MHGHLNVKMICGSKYMVTSIKWSGLAEWVKWFAVGWGLVLFLVGVELHRHSMWSGAQGQLYHCLCPLTSKNQVAPFAGCEFYKLIWVLLVLLWTLCEWVTASLSMWEILFGVGYWEQTMVENTFMAICKIPVWKNRHLLWWKHALNFIIFYSRLLHESDSPTSKSYPCYRSLSAAYARYCMLCNVYVAR